MSPRQAIRALAKSPGTSLVVIATVAIGLCAVATVFAVVDTFFLKPLPGVARQAELVNVHATAPDGSSFHSVSLPTWRDLQEGNGALSGLAAFSSRIVSIGSGSEPRLAVVQVVTGNYFSVLGARPALGRFFLPEEDRAPGRDAVVVLSHRLWKSDFGADPGVAGRVLSINGHPFTVVGVTEPAFNGTFVGQPFDLFVPTMMAPVVGTADRLESRDYVWLELVGRRRPGVSLKTAQAAFSAAGRRLEKAYPEVSRGVGFNLLPTTGFEDALRGSAIGFFGLLAGLSGLVLAIAGVNVSGILLARAVARERELSVRLALGAGQGRLLRQLLAENVLLFLAGGAAGMLLTFATLALLERIELPTTIPITFDLQPGARVFAFALVLSAVAGALFGLVAAVPATRPSALALLRAGASTERHGASRLRAVFVAAQVAMSALLLVAAGLFLRTVHQTAGVNPGFEPDGLTMTTVDLKLLGYDAARAGLAFEQIVARASAFPGVESATTAGRIPLGVGNRTSAVALPESPPGEPLVRVDFADVGDGYFSTLRLPLLAGRPFGPADVPGAPGAAIVNETLARKLWPGRNPIGQRLRREDSATKAVLTVVGVARDAKYRRLWEEPLAFLYVSERQSGSLRRELVVRGGGPPEALAAQLRRAIRAVEPNLPFAPAITVRRYMGFSLLPQRIGSAVAGALGVVGLLLAGIGLAAQVAYSVSRRTREIGIRMALGARPADILVLETGRGVKTAAIGLALGLLGALLLSQSLVKFLFGVSPADPLTYGAVALLLAATSLAATFPPARRAARIDPMKALRSE
jgi:predicted permease